MKEGEVYVNPGTFCKSKHRERHSTNGIGPVGIACVEKISYDRVRQGGENERETPNMSPFSVLF